jgi:mannose-1-phosphate guanylyltransferase
MYSVFIKPLFITLKEQKEYKEYIKTIEIVKDFMSTDKFENIEETKRIKIAEEYLTLMSFFFNSGNSTNRNLDDYKKLSRQTKEIFKDVIPEFKQEDRNKKLDKLLNDGY